MPKIYLTEKDRIRAAYRARDQCFLEHLIVRLRRKKMYQKDLEPLTKLSHSTFCRRLKDPEQFTIAQARIIFDVLEFSDEERFNLIGGKK